MTDKFWLLGLLVLLIGGVCGLMAAAAFGASPNDCVKYESDVMVKITTYSYMDSGDYGDCDAVVENYLDSGNWTVGGYNYAGNTGTSESWVLTK
ncbi:MAG: hypothetical protein R2685_10745 [Candidatus Nitrosocosmicus sp.]|nr:hypothetical protein [Candidatus Nitrosocosmicus sp.]